MKRKHYPILTSPVPETAAGAINFATQRGEISEVAEPQTKQAFPAKAAERPGV